MTILILSHNLQIEDANVPLLSALVLSEGLKQYCDGIDQSEALVHPHWMVKLVSSRSAAELVNDLPAAWRALRHKLGHHSNHAVLALGGRKDDLGKPGSPLQQGDWGIDLVETTDSAGFLQSINWDSLKGGRPADGVIEVLSLGSN
ncbi:MAG: DUF2656 family protein [Cyanobacteria bacterium]|nr:DUF2656 family protein [Cyanobacteriota bacterium]